MKKFILIVCGSFVGAFLAFMFFMIATMIMSFAIMGSMSFGGSKKAVSVSKHSILKIDLGTVVSERSGSEGLDMMAMLQGGGMPEDLGLNTFISAVKNAAENDKVDGIYIECNGVSAAPATLQAMRRALKEFKKSGKWIVAYADQYMQGSYYVATVADKIYLNGEGMINFSGLGGKNEYMKGLYDKLGIKYQAAKVGKYKSYVERNTLTGMSEYDREQRTAYLNGIWNYWLKEMAEGRKVKPEDLNQLANDSIIMFADTKDYVKSKLIDKVMFPEEIKAEIKNRLKLDKDDEIPQLTLSDMLNVKTDKDEEGEKIAIYYAYGSIVDNEALDYMSGGGHNIVGKRTAEDLRKLADDDDVKAVVFRINSGGGSAVASEQIRHAVKLLKAKKPVVVSMGGAAASGGYWISSPANYIFAEPTTITGSIGIFGLIPNFSGLVTDKLGITFDGVTTNKFSDAEMNLVLAKDNAEEMKYLQGHVDRGYISFLNVVSEGRGMKPAQVDSIAQGRVWLATDAVKIKLVDKLGSLDDAVKKAAELAKVSDYYTTTYPGESSWMDTFFPKEKKGSYLDGELRMLLGELYEPLMEIRKTIKDGSRIQARMLDDIRVK